VTAAPSEHDLAVLRSFARRIDPADAGAHNNLGVLYYQKGLLDEAVDAFARALDLDPRMQVAQANLELAARESGTFDRRRSELEARLARAPEDHDLRLELARLHARLGMHEAAVREADTLLLWHPDDAAALLLAGQAEHAIGRLDEAARRFTRVLHHSPGHAAAAMLLGETLYQRGEPERALEVLEQAVAAAPEHAEAHHLLSFVYGDLGRHEDARSASRRALQLNPSLGRAQANLSLARRGAPVTVPQVVEGAALTHYALGLAFRQKGLHVDALREYRMALEAGEEPRFALQGIAEVELLRGAPQAALEAYDQLLRQYPDSPKLWNERGVALQHLGQPAEAEDAFRCALRVDDVYALAWNNLGVVCARQNRWDEAAAAFATALARSPRLGAARLNAALAAARRGDAAGAVAAYQDVLASEPDSAAAWNGLGLVLMDGGRLAEARAAFARAVDAEPALASAHYNLGFVLSRLGEHDAALAATRQAMEREPYYVSQHFMLAIDVQFEHPTIRIPALLGGDVPLNYLPGLDLDGTTLDAAFAELAPPPPEPNVEPAERLIETARAHRDAGRLDAAAEVARRVRSPAAAVAEAQVVLGDVFARRGLHGEALERYRAALAGLPTSREAMLGVLRSQLAQGRGADAAADAHEAVRRHAGDGVVLATAAFVFLATRDGAAALGRARAACALAPQTALAHEAHAEALDARGERLAAAEALSRALEREPNTPRLWRRLAELELARGDATAARGAFRRALELLPTYAEAALGLARLELRLNEPALAIGVLADLCAADPASPDALALLGRALFTAARPAQALVAADRALRLDASHGEALLLRGEVLVQQRQFAPAIAAWQRLLDAEPSEPIAQEARTRLRAATDLQKLFAPAG